MASEVVVELGSVVQGEGTIAVPVNPRHLYDNLAIPAGTRCIRLLDLDAETAGWENMTTPPPSLSGSLRLAGLDPVPNFAALSYVWGGGEAIHRTITCHGCDLEITENYYQALWHIQRRFGAVAIWVDSICINQADDDEKAGQIALMGEVYGLAASVYVWLGLADADSDNAVKYLKTRARQARRLPLAVVAARTPGDRRRESWWLYCQIFADIRCKRLLGAP